MRMKAVLACLTILAVVGLLAPMHGSATIITYTDRGSFPDNNYVDWAQFGAEFTVVPNNSVATAAFFGTTVTVSTSTGTAMEQRKQGSGWTGNFARGDAVLWTRNVNNLLILDFSHNVWGGGAQIQRNLFGPFTGTLAAYDGGNNLLGSFDLAGYSDPYTNNTAIFMGIFSTGADVRRLVFSVDNGTGDFAINKLEFLECTVVPLPGTLFLLGSGLLSLARLRRRQR